MSTGEQTAPGSPGSATNEGITTPPPVAGIPPTALTDAAPAEQRIDLPPIPAPALPPPVDPRRGRTLDGVLLVLLIAFAFLCASFKARNTDLFQHLATGRLIAEGKYTFGGDPFSFASKGPWINHAWLFDLLLYGLYGFDPSGVALVVVKALLVVLLTWIMFRTASRPGERLWLPIVCTTLGLLALSPRVWVQPSLASMLLLAVTFFLLVRPSDRPGRLWLLPLVCLAWVNLDVWFLLGPITIGAYLLGQFLSSPQQDDTTPMPAPPAVTPATLGLVFLASVAACLCNPFHFRAFVELPTGMVRFARLAPLEADNTFRGFFLSPFLDTPLYFHENIGLNVAGLAYFALLAVSLISFVAVGIMHRPAFRGDFFLLWLVFVLLSGLHIRAIPFFAIVASPIAALNFFALLRRPVPATLRPSNVWNAYAIPGRVLTVVVLLALCVGSISGIIQAQPHARRQLGWGIEEDQSLAGAARQIVAWEKEGLLAPGQNWMTLSPEAVHYLAWFAPGEKGFVDHRLSLFGDAGDEFIALRRSLAGERAPVEAGGEPAPPAWRKIFRERKVRFLLFHPRDITRSLAPLLMLYGNPSEFVPCYVEGGTAIFAWRDPQEKSASPVDRRMAIDFGQRAFGPHPERAPATPGAPPGALPWWWPILRPEAPSPPDAAQAVQYSTQFDALSFTFQREAQSQWFAAGAASLVGLGRSPGGPLPAGILLPTRFFATYGAMVRNTPVGNDILDRLALADLMSFARRLDAGPPASLYLSIRACRRALALNPEDGQSHLLLAKAYSRLTSQTKEHSRHWAPAPPGSRRREQLFFGPVQLVRQTQTAAALRNLLRGTPPPEQAQQAHLLLADVFREPQYLEPRIEHLRKYLDQSKALRGLIGVPQALFDQEVKTLEKGVKDLERQLKSKRDQYEVNAGNKKLIQKVRIAIEHGLAETALNLLLNAPGDEFNAGNNQQEAAGVRMALLELLLGLGRVEEAEMALTPQPGSEGKFDPRAFGVHPLGLPAYEWFQVQKSAATGDYAAADRYLEECLGLLHGHGRNAEVLEKLGVLPRKDFKKDPDLSVLAAALTGDFLLRESQRLTHKGWYWQLASLVGYQRERKGWVLQNPPVLRFFAGRDYLFSQLAREGNLWTIRAWLALEEGSIDKARIYANRANDYADLGGYDPAIRQKFTSIPLAKLILELTARPGDKK